MTDLDKFPSPLTQQNVWWFDAFPNLPLDDDRAHTLRLAYAYGHRLRRFHQGQVWHCHDDGIWRLEPEAIVTAMTQHLPLLLVREAAEHDRRQDIPSRIDVTALSTSIGGKLRNIRAAATFSENFAEQFNVRVLAEAAQQVYTYGTPDHFFFAHDDPYVVAWLDTLVRLTPDGPVPEGPPLPHHYLRATTGHNRSEADPHAPGLHRQWEEQVLTRFIPDPAVRDFIRLKLGTNLLGKEAKDAQLIQLYGHGANGKSTLTKTSIKCVGEYGNEVDARFFGAERGTPETQHRTYVPAIIGRRCITNGDELGKNAVINDEVMKGVTEGEQITFRRMHHDEEKVTSNVTPWVATNNPISFKKTGLQKATQRRVYIIEMPNTLQDHEMNPAFKSTLLSAHADDLCAWHEAQAVRYLRERHRSSAGVLIAPPTVQRQTQAHLLKEIPLGFFILDCLRPSDKETPVEEIYAAYCVWRYTEGPEDEAALPEYTQTELLRHIPLNEFPTGGKRPQVPKLDGSGEMKKTITRKCEVIHPFSRRPVIEDVFTEKQRAEVEEYVELALLRWDETAEVYFTDLDTQASARREEERELWRRAIAHFTETGQLLTVLDHFAPPPEEE